VLDVMLLRLFLDYSKLLEFFLEVLRLIEFLFMERRSLPENVYGFVIGYSRMFLLILLLGEDDSFSREMGGSLKQLD
jgi:hypothetical protein